jgi:hypothetical protein
MAYIDTFDFREFNILVDGKPLRGFTEDLLLTYDKPLNNLKVKVFSCQKEIPSTLYNEYHISINYSNGKFPHLNVEGSLELVEVFNNVGEDIIPYTTLTFRNTQFG